MLGRTPPPDAGKGPGEREADPSRDTRTLETWLAPTTTSQIDHVALAEIHETWTPERTGQLSIMVTVSMIKAVGVVDPVLLRPRADGPGYEAVTGHRIVAAARLAGLDRIPAVVREMDDAHALTALALDGTATGTLTPAGAAELRRRLRDAGVPPATVEELLAAVPGAPVIEPPGEPPEVPPEPAPEEVPPEAGLPEAAPEEVPPEPAPEEVPPEAGLPEAAPVEVEVPAAEPAATATPVEPVAVPAAPAAAPPPRWVPLPAGRPRLARLSSAFVDTPRLLRHLAADRFSGTVEMVGHDRRSDVLLFVEGALVAVAVDLEGRRVDLPVRLPAPETPPLVDITVRPHPLPVAVALALGLRAPAELVGLHAAFLHFPGLLEHLARRRVEAACVVTAPGGHGVVLLAGGRPVAAYARRRGEEPGEEAETTDVDAVADLLAGGEGEVDVHTGPVPPAIDVEALIAASGL